MQKATMVLEGGATRGVFSSGALDYLMEKDFYTSHVIGVSAGACNAVDYVSRQIGRTRDCMIHKEPELNYFYGFRKGFKEKSLMDMDMIFDKYPNELIPFDFDTYFHSEMHCELVTTNCKTGKAEYMTEDSDSVRLMKIARASSSMPLVSPIVNVDGIPYLDGGLADSVPVNRALEIGNEKIVLILTRNPRYRKSALPRGIVKLYRGAYKKYPNLVHAILTRNFYYNKVMNQIDALEREGKVFVLRPLVKPVSRLEKDYDLLMAFYQHGYDEMKKQYEKLEAYMEK
ncbi:MAG: patatin family protein [Hespellia sp.]|nr:patatin family protein [Hespellia sp.]